MLADTAIKRARCKDQPYRINDGCGLYLIVNPDGSRWWRFAYTCAGKRNNMSLGVYPDTCLATARLGLDDADG